MLLLIPAIAAGAGTPDAPPLSTMQHGGLERTWRLYTPPNLDRSRKAPLVMVLHGAGGDSARMVVTTHFNDLADANRFLVAYVDGYEKHWNDLRGIPEWSAHKNNVDDVGYFSALIDRLVATAGVDAKRVYVTGISNGGLMSHRLGCELADKVAAIAPVVRTFTEKLADGCHPARAIPVLMFFGTADKLVPFEGGKQKMGSVETPVLSARGTIEKWASLDGCKAPARVTKEPPKEKLEYQGCRAPGRVTAYILEGAGHTWPPDASAIIWKFFDQPRIDSDTHR
jgi:polyhydroxybutyrate depolymerase